MSSTLPLLFLLQIGIPILLGVIGQQIAKKKNLNPKDGFLAGIFGNVIGIIILLSVKERSTPFTSTKDFEIEYHIRNKAVRIVLKIASVLLLIMVSMFFGLIEMKSRGASTIRPAFTLSWMFYSYILIFSRFSKYTIWGKEIPKGNDRFIHEAKSNQVRALKNDTADKKPKDSPIKNSNNETKTGKLNAYKLEDGKTLFVDENGKVVDVSEVQEYVLEDGSKIYVKGGEVINLEPSSKEENLESDETIILEEKPKATEGKTDIQLDQPINEDSKNLSENDPQKTTTKKTLQEHSDNASKLPESNPKIFLIAMIGFVVVISGLFFYSESKKTESTETNLSQRYVIPKRVIDSLNGVKSPKAQVSKPKPSTTQSNYISPTQKRNNQLRQTVKENLNLGRQYSDRNMQRPAITQYDSGINLLLEFGLRNLDNDNIKLLSDLFFQRAKEKDRLKRTDAKNSYFSESATSDREKAIEVLDYLKY